MGIPEKISREVSPDPSGKPRTELISGAGSKAGRWGWRGRGGCPRMEWEMRCF